MDEAQTAKATATTADTTEVGQQDLRRIADHHVLDGTASIDEDTYLSMELCRKRCKLRRKLCRDHIRWSDTPAIQAFECLDLTGLESLRVARYLFSHRRNI